MWFYRANTYCIVLHVIYTLFPLVILIAMRSATQLQATPTKISVKFAYPCGYDVRSCKISSKNKMLVKLLRLSGSPTLIVAPLSNMTYVFKLELEVMDFENSKQNCVTALRIKQFRFSQVVFQKLRCGNFS